MYFHLSAQIQGPHFEPAIQVFGHQLNNAHEDKITFLKNCHMKEEYTIVSKKLSGRGIQVVSGSSKSKKAVQK